MNAALPALAAGLEAVIRSAGLADLPDLELTRARNPEYGDYQSPVAMKLAGRLRRAPALIAEELAAGLPSEPATVEAVNGYLNFRLTPAWLRRVVAHAASELRYGSAAWGGATDVQVEFVSVNPTGPLHIGHGRGAILGDTLCRLLEFTGHSVQREYYVNDRNTQAVRFGRSVYARLHGEEPPADGYPGEYVAELAELARRDLPGIDLRTEADAEPVLRRYAIERMVERLRASLERLNVRFDQWFWESTVWDTGLAGRAIERLREGGHLTEREGALWFAPQVGGWAEEDEDRVVIRSTGEPTYFASDLGYLLSRFEARGFDRVVEVWGADHHGYVPRMKAATAALGYDPDRLLVILNQMVNLREGKMSKRQGRFVTLDELVDRAGVDAVRYFYLLRSPDTSMEFDLELAVARRSENPVYYAQYAHARLANVEPAAAARHPDGLAGVPDLDLLTQPWELDVARQIAFWPDAVDTAARQLEPHRLPYYVHDLADSVHNFYQAGNEDSIHRVVVDDPAVTRARLELCRAARNTLRIALDLMGVSAPDRM